MSAAIKPGMVRTILTDDHPTLTTPSSPASFEDPQLPDDVADLAATLEDFRRRAGFGRAISAPQIGISKRLIVMNLGAGPVALLNPSVVERSTATQQVWDDCLSVPDKIVLVERNKQVSVDYHDRSGRLVHWKDLAADLSELLQHEIDHLDGVLMTDRVIGDAIAPLADRDRLIGPSRPARRITAAGIAKQRPRIDQVFANTPQYNCEPLSDRLGCWVTLKVETLNPIGSFKGRGASVLVADHVAERGPDVPMVAASAGNWGQAIGYACRRAGVSCTVFAATGANPAKVERMRALGVEVVLFGDDFDAAKAQARTVAAKRDAIFVEDGQDVAVTEGHGSMAAELLDRMAVDGDHLDAVIVPVGNGAMINGVAHWTKAASPATEVIGVVTTGARSMQTAWNRPEEPELWNSSTVDTIADGLAVRVPVADAVADMQDVVDDVVSVDDGRIAAAMADLHRIAGLVTEPAGAAGIAALADDRERFAGRHVAVIICGANVDPAVAHLLTGSG